MCNQARTCRSASIHSNMARCSASPKLSGQKKASAEARVGSGEWGVEAGGEVRPRVGSTAAAHLEEEPPGGGSLQPLNASQKSTRMSAQRGQPISERQPCIAVPTAWCDKDASQWKAHLCCTLARAAGPDRRSSAGCRPAAVAAWQTAPCGRGGQAAGLADALSKSRHGRFGAAEQPTAAKPRLPPAGMGGQALAIAAALVPPEQHKHSKGSPVVGEVGVPLVVAWHYHVGQLGGRWLDARQEGGAPAALQGRTVMT